MRAETAKVRAATAADLPAIEQLLLAANLPLDGVREALPTFLVADARGDIVGVAGLELCGDNALLRSVAVRPDWRSRGLGRRLVSESIANAEYRRIHSLYLLTTTAEQYFATLGFRKIERSHVPDDVRATAEFRIACPASATVLFLPLAGEEATQGERRPEQQL